MDTESERYVGPLVGYEAPGKTRRKLRLGPKTPFYLWELVADPQRFQYRSPIADGREHYGRHKGRSEAHIRDMARRIQDTGEPLDPMVVWREPGTGELFIVDGFHRFAAYRRARDMKAWRKNRKVPCRVAQGTEQEVVSAVLGQNSKAKLGFNQAQRLQCAWESVWEGLFEDLSVREAAKRHGIGHNTMWRMRNARRERFGDCERLEDLGELRLWRNVKPEPDGQPVDMTEDEELKEEIAATAERILAALEAAHWRPEVLGPALEQAFESHGSLRAALVDENEEKGDF